MYQVPAGIDTTWFDPAQFEIAWLIAAAFALALPLPAAKVGVAHTVVRLGIPPGTPTLLQSIARLGSSIPDQGGWPYEPIEKQKSAKTREDRKANLNFILPRDWAHPKPPRPYGAPLERAI